MTNRRNISSSFVILPSVEVRDKATKCIQVIDELRRQALDEWVENIVAQQRRSWLRRLFGIRPQTREQVIDYYQRGSFIEMMDLYEIRAKYGSAKVIAENLLAAAEIVDEVYVLAAECRLISSFIEDVNDDDVVRDAVVNVIERFNS